MPYAFWPKFEAKLELLEFLGIITKVKTAEFSTTPIVPVLKPNCSLKICGDVKISDNQYLNFTQYTLSHIKEVFKRLSGSQVFFKLDQPDAYL